jgi:hypothetical protein
MGMYTLKAHYDHLREVDQARWSRFNSELAAIVTTRGDGYTYFKRSVLEAERKRPDKLNLIWAPAGVIDKMVEFLNLTREQLYSHDIPFFNAPQLGGKL